MAIVREKKVHLWASWNYEKEEAYLDRVSGEGLHLEKAGAVRSTFVRDGSVRYVYRLDYQTGITPREKKEEYVALYRDAGWEYVSSYGAMWHYFRRPREPGETPSLYSDKESLAAHYRKTQAVMTLVNLLLLLFLNLGLWFPAGGVRWGIAVPMLTGYSLLFGLLGYGFVKMGRKAKTLSSS
ncbi:DUF2812 domain-containing protein [Cohnella suwonensis]|uniref:DUF2812 domain-containing protein n=1 Tax=Cohnella suwonensis TaxID=696072 RepID=A0ABW0LS16_9BACL